MRNARRIVLVGACVALGLVTAGTTAAHRSTPSQAHGRVKCIDHRHVVGVWVHGHRRGVQGFAHWHAVEGKPFIAHYSFDMGVQQTYTVHVGCGGTPHHWATNNKSPWVGPSGRPVDFVCFDAHNHGGPYERCHVGFPD